MMVLWGRKVRVPGREVEKEKFGRSRVDVNDGMLRRGSLKQGRFGYVQVHCTLCLPPIWRDAPGGGQPRLVVALSLNAKPGRVAVMGRWAGARCGTDSGLDGASPPGSALARVRSICPASCDCDNEPSNFQLLGILLPTILTTVLLLA